MYQQPKVGFSSWPGNALGSTQPYTWQISRVLSVTERWLNGKTIMKNPHPEDVALFEAPWKGAKSQSSDPGIVGVMVWN